MIKKEITLSKAINRSVINKIVVDSVSPHPFEGTDAQGVSLTVDIGGVKVSYDLTPAEFQTMLKAGYKSVLEALIKNKVAANPPA